jgi:hypothetical protein
MKSTKGFSVLKSGDTYSRAFGTTIGPESLTAVFEMGTGVTFRICSPERNRRRGKASAGSCIKMVVVIGDLLVSNAFSSKTLGGTFRNRYSERAPERLIMVAKLSSVSTG